MKLFIQRFLISIGIIMLLISITAGILIIIFSFKFASYHWISWWQYVLSMLGLGIGAMFVALAGIFSIYLATDNEGENNDSRQKINKTNK